MICSFLWRKSLPVILLFSTAPAAHAYIDPGTGSLLVQGLLAAIAGAMVAVRFYWHRILTFFGLNKNKGNQDQDDENSAG